MYTPDHLIIDLVATDPDVWGEYVSPESTAVILGEVQRWSKAVAEGASLDDAIGYSRSGEGYDFKQWQAKWRQS